MKSEFRTKENEHDNFWGLKCFHSKNFPINCTGRIIKTFSPMTYEFPAFRKAYINNFHASLLAKYITLSHVPNKPTSHKHALNIHLSKIENFNVHKCNTKKLNKARDHKFGRMGELRWCH